MTTGGNWRIEIFDETDGWKSISSATLSQTGVNANKIRLNYSNHGDGATISKVQIELGSSATSFAPYSNECPILGRDRVVVDDVGKNLIAGWQKNTAIDNNGEPYTSAGSVTTSNKIHAEVGDSFIYSSETIAGVAYYIQTYDAYDNYIGYKQIAFGTAFVPTNFDSRIRSFYIQINGSNIGNTPPETAQLERGSTATAYVPYAHSSATIQLGTTVYGADINWDTGVMTVKTAFKTYDGSETWAASNSGQDGCMRCETVLPSDAKPNTSNTTLVGARFNEYTEKTPNQTWGGGSDSIGVSISNTISNKVYLSVCQTGLRNMNVADFKAWLASNNLQVEYTLATPTTIQLTPEQLEMLKGYNRVTVESGSIELGYIAKIA